MKHVALAFALCLMFSLSTQAQNKTSDRDAVQSAFYLISGSPDWRRATYSLLADVKTAVPAFRSFIVAGSDHGLLPVDAFYSYRSDDVVLHQWVGRLIAGESVEDVRCVGCVQQAESRRGRAVTFCTEDSDGPASGGR